jgi:hypothetical protein
MSEKFEVGDIVEALGCRGIVKEAADRHVKVYFESNEYVFFYPDGKLYDWQKEPSLKLIEKAKKEEPKKKYYRVIFKDNQGVWHVLTSLVDENFEDTTGKERAVGCERKLLTDWSVEL